MQTNISRTTQLSENSLNNFQSYLLEFTLYLLTALTAYDKSKREQIIAYMRYHFTLEYRTHDI